MADPDHNAHDAVMKKKLLDARRLENLAKARQKAAELRDELIAMKLDKGKKKPTKLEQKILDAKKDLQSDQKDDEQTTAPSEDETPIETPTETPIDNVESPSATDSQSVFDPDPTTHEQGDHHPQKSKRAPAKRTPRAKSAPRAEPRRAPKEDDNPTEVIEPIPRAPLYRREGGLLFI